MWIEEIHIEGFGIFRDLHLEKLPKTMTLMIGDNEAGKSTLMAFVRQLLFGFPTKRDARKQYSPQHGGKLGGTMVLRTEKNECYRLRRTEGPHGGTVSLQLPDGGEGSTGELERLRGNATVDMYETIFAFSLDELQSFETLTREKVKDIIYSTGLGIRPEIILNFSKWLKGEIEKLYTPRSKTALIKSDLKTIDGLKEQLENSREAIGEYTLKKSELSEKEDRMKELEGELERLRREDLENRLLFKTYDDWHELRRLTSERDSLPDTSSFPESGPDKLKRLTLKIENEQSECARITGDIEQKKDTLDRLPGDRFLLEQTSGIESLVEKRAQYIQAKKDLPERKSALMREKIQLEKKLEGLGPGWKEKKLREFDISLHVKGEVRSFRDRIARAHEKAAAESGELEHCRKTAGAARRKAEEAEREFNALPEPERTDEDEIKRCKKILNEMSDQLSERKVIAERLDGYIQRKQDTESALESFSLSSNAAQMGLFLPGYIIALLLILSGITVFSIWKLLFASLALAGTGLLTAGVYIYLQKKNLVAGNGAGSSRRKRISLIKSQIAHFEDKIGELSENISEIHGTVMKRADEMGIEPPDNEISLRERLEQLERTQDEFRTWSDRQTRMRLAEKELKKAERDMADAEEERKKSEAFEAETEREWRNWLAEKGLKQELTPESVFDIFSEIEKARKDMTSIDSIGERIAQMTGAINEYEEDLRNILDSIPEFEPGDSLPEDIAAALKREHERQKEILNKRGQLDEQIRTQEKELNRRESDLEKLRQELRDLFEQAGADGEDDFLRIKRDWENAARLNRAIDEVNERLVREAGPRFWEKLDAELTDTTLPDIEARQHTIDRKLSDLSASRDTLKEDVGKLKNIIENLEKESGETSSRFEYEAAMTDLGSHAYEWAVRVTARELLNIARKHYEKDRQPEVIKAAGRYFSLITNGAYMQVVSQPDTGRMYIVDRHSKVKYVGDALSRGTAEELYYSLRLGLISEFSSRTEPLPVIMDDVFVNFDPKRAESAAGTLGELSRTNQVFYFTCHPSIAEFIQSEYTDITTVRLHAGQAERV
ncbi:AAA family ATPase [candidate division KSB1 bacterium]